jgi:hypothetical protein
MKRRNRSVAADLRIHPWASSVAGAARPLAAVPTVADGLHTIHAGAYTGPTPTPGVP